jgi:hypothetical protein
MGSRPKPVVDFHRGKWKSIGQETSRSAQGNLLSPSNIPFTAPGASRLDAESRCEACGAGASVWFNWQYANDRQTPEDLRRIAFFAQWKELRRGTLYHCRICDEVWHLDGKAEQMTHVSSERQPLVLEWDREETAVPSDISEMVERIGPTPPDVYGNEQDRRITPCKVVTRSGEVFETAMICVQLDAPVQDHMLFRLGSEIAEVSASAFALPREVREASSRAQEMRMGFSPTLIEVPDGKRFVMNGMTSFMVEPGYEASDARLIDGSYFSEDPPPRIVGTPTNLVYFIFDGDPNWSIAPVSNVDGVPTRK